MSLNHAIETCDLPALIAKHCGHEAVRGLGPKGGTIRDPRPGMRESHPSFSVWLSPAGTWMWKKRGRNAGSGTAYMFLQSLGWIGRDIRAELLSFTGTQSAWSVSQVKEPPQQDILAQARAKLAELRPITGRELGEVRGRCQVMRETDAAAEELKRRGLWPMGDLQACTLGGDLAFAVRGPEGRVYNLKRRREGAGSKYKVVVPGHGTPAWCNSNYGQARKVLLVEGELNAAAAWKVITALGLDFDVQGLPGADTWPFLEGLEREVWIYADGDDSGERMRARLQELAFACGSTKVRQIPALGEQDFCDLLGEGGVDALNEALHAGLESAAPNLRLASGPMPSIPQPSLAVAARAQVLLGQPEDYSGWPLVKR